MQGLRKPSRPTIQRETSSPSTAGRVSPGAFGQSDMNELESAAFCRKSWSIISAHPLKPWMKQSPLALKAESYIIPGIR